MESFVLVIHVIVAVILIALVLMQQGKGAEMGASFGSGASQTVFGAAGSASILTKATWIFAGLFLMLSLWLAWHARQQVNAAAAPAAAVQEVPATPASAPSSGGAPSVPAAPAK
jgi:preprotein translocase subunit SecG